MRTPLPYDMTLPSGGKVISSNWSKERQIICLARNGQDRYETHECEITPELTVKLSRSMVYLSDMFGGAGKALDAAFLNYKMRLGYSRIEESPAIND